MATSMPLKSTSGLFGKPEIQAKGSNTMLNQLDGLLLHSEADCDLHAENQKLKQELELVKSRNACLSKTFEIENQYPGFDVPTDWMYSQLSTVNYRLHDELLHFKAQIEEQMGQVDQLARQLCAKLRQLVADIDSDLDVGHCSG